MEPFILLALLLFAITPLALFILGIWDRITFEKNFPPISDEEFLRRCRPGTNPEIALRVRRIVAKHLCVPYERVYPSSRFVEDLHAD